MYFEIYEKYKKEVLSSIALLLCIAIGYSVFILVGRIGKVAVEFHVVPNDSKVIVNDQSYTSGTYYLPAGTYTVHITHDGFTSVDTSINASTQKPKNIIAVSLAPSSDQAKKWADSHQSAYKDNEKYGAEQARQDGQFFRDSFPIINQLPYQDPYYKIAYRSTNNQSVTLTIQTESPRYRYMAIQKIRDLGFNPTDYIIDFRDYRNPLEQHNE